MEKSKESIIEGKLLETEELIPSEVGYVGGWPELVRLRIESDKKDVRDYLLFGTSIYPVIKGEMVGKKIRLTEKEYKSKIFIRYNDRSSKSGDNSR